MKAERLIVFLIGLSVGLAGGRAARVFWESTRADAAVERNTGFMSTTLKVETDEARGYHCYWITSHPQSSPSCVAIRYDLPARATTPPQGMVRCATSCVWRCPMGWMDPVQGRWMNPAQGHKEVASHE